MATIKIADEGPHPRRTEFADDVNTSGIANDHSIYNLRPLGRTLTNQTSGTSRTNLSEDGIRNIRSRTERGYLSRRMSIASKDGLEEDEDPDLRRQSDYKQKQTFSKAHVLWLSYQSLGVIYGDIGTSPLYVYSSTFPAPPSRENLIGVLSIIIWSLTIMVTIKYILIVLYCDNDGEGGSFSTYSLLSRYTNITHRDPREATFVQMKRIKSDSLGTSGRAMRRGLEHSRFLQNVLKVVGCFAVTAVLADGVLTPAQSVLGAVQGIEVVQPGISKAKVLGTTDAILIFLFAIQPLGISKLTFAFSPIIIIWLLFNAVFGMYNLAKHDAGVFKAFDPGEAFDFLIRNGHDGWKMLGGVLLSFTGVEALFADLGAFSRPAIQLSWLCFAYPCLLLAYIGQASYIADFPDAYTNPFFNAAPPGTLYPSLIIAILAAIVASQAIITATCQLLSQVMKLSYFPQLKVVHTSTTFHGQMYIPLINWLLMIGTVLIASIYNNTTSLGNAYGVCVILVTFFDTTMVSLAAIFVWGFKPYFVFFPWLIIALHDGVYLSAVMDKVPDGGWFTLTLAAILASIFLTWRFGKEQQWAAEAQSRFPSSHFIHTSADGRMRLTDAFGRVPLSATRGLGIFFDKAGETTPIVFSQFAIKLTALPEVMVLFHLRPIERPSVPFEERYSVTRLAIPHCYRLVVRYGFNDSVVSDDLGSIIYAQVRAHIEREALEDAAPPAMPPPSPGLDGSSDTSTAAAHETDLKAHATTTGPHHPAHARVPPAEELERLDAAYQHKVLYIVGKESLKLKPPAKRRVGAYFRAAVLWCFLWMRENTRAKIADLRLPGDLVVEVGFLKEL